MRILALVNAHALAHVSRALEVAKTLRWRGHVVGFAGYGQYLSVAEDAGFDTFELPYTPLAQLLEAVRSQRLDKLFPRDQLALYVDAERALYRQFGPDLLLGDNRVTASTSAELQGLPLASIVNVHMTRYKAVPFYSLAQALRVRPNWATRGVDRAVNAFESLLYDRWMMGGMRKLREELGLPRRHGHALEDGDLTLLPDLPQFNPVSRLPRNGQYVGPLIWRNQLPPPRCLDELDPERPCLYFSIGSAGFNQLVERMSVFARTGAQIVIATGNSELPAPAGLPEGVFAETFVNADALLPHCHLVVCHGGNGTIYQALRYGLPIVGIATHQEQFYGLKRVRQLGLGCGFSPKQLHKRGLDVVVEAVKHVLSDESYRRNACRFRQLLAGDCSAERAATLIEDLAGARRRQPVVGGGARAPEATRFGWRSGRAARREPRAHNPGPSLRVAEARAVPLNKRSGT